MEPYLQIGPVRSRWSTLEQNGFYSIAVGLKKREREGEREWRAAEGEGPTKAKQASCRKAKGRNWNVESGRQEYHGLLVPTSCGRNKGVSLKPSEDHVADNHLTLALSLEFMELRGQTLAVCIFVIVFLEK